MTNIDHEVKILYIKNYAKGFSALGAFTRFFRSGMGHTGGGYAGFHEIHEVRIGCASGFCVS